MYDPDMEYEEFLEHQGDQYMEEDLALHESIWPNGYGRCDAYRCTLEVYHDGDHEELDDAAWDLWLHRHDQP